MSRSAPTATTTNPCTRFYSWSGSKGVLKYYDKEAKKDIEVEGNFTFLLLDSLSTISGYHEPSKSSIYANEIRDTRKDKLVVKSFKGGVLVEGLYADIKDRAKTLGGRFTASLYIAYRDGEELKIGNIAFTGAALGEWMDFAKHNKGPLDTMAVQIDGTKGGQKGSVKYKVPTFALIGVQPKTQDDAIALDRQLQEYLATYLAKTASTQPTALTEDRPEDIFDREYGDEDVPTVELKEPAEDDPAEEDIPF